MMARIDWAKTKQRQLHTKSILQEKYKKAAIYAKTAKPKNIPRYEILPLSNEIKKLLTSSLLTSWETQFLKSINIGLLKYNNLTLSQLNVLSSLRLKYPSNGSALLCSER